MSLKFITAFFGGVLLLAIGACGGASPEATSTTITSTGQSSPRVSPVVTPFTPDFLYETFTPQPVAEQTPTSSPGSSLRASVVDSTYSRRTPFVPLDQPAFLSARKTNYLPDEDLVLGLEWMGETRAYPIRMLTYHHIVNDTVAGRPLLITY